MSFKTVPITLITGYLGSGKTTLINHILNNAKNHKIAVIVNDLGEVNIDADLIQKGGVVSSQDDNLVALQNGCICCTLKKDLINQLAELVNMQRFDHILIEASGICEPVPIAQTISYMESVFEQQKLPKFYKIDAIISVTDVLRLRDEFNCGEALEEKKELEEDLESLVIQQIEFCNLILLNKVSEISKEELNKVKKVIRAIQPTAKLVECDYCNVDIDDLIDTNLFDFDEASGSAAWIREFEDWNNEVEEDEDHDHDEDDEDEDHEEEHHHHHHHHHHEHGLDENDDEGTADEYDVNTYVYYRRRPFDREKFMNWVNSTKIKIIRSKGILYFSDEKNMVYLYESAGKQKNLTASGEWYSANHSKKQIDFLRHNDENYAHDWDDEYQDKLIKLVFIGQNLPMNDLKKELDLILE